jgi:flagellar motor switch protein FliN/FliY
MKIDIELIDLSHLSAAELHQYLEPNTISIPLKLSPLEGSAYWICSKETLSIWTAPLPESFSDGYFRFLLLETLRELSSFESLSPIQFTLSETGPAPETDAFVFNLKIDFNGERTFAKLALDPELMKSLRSKFSVQKSFFLQKAKHIPIEVGVQVGQVSLSKTQWENVTCGDFIVLDSESYDPKKSTGFAYLTLNSRPIFQIRIKNNKVAIIDYASIEKAPMNEEPFDPIEEIKQSDHLEQEDATDTTKDFSSAEPVVEQLKEVSIPITVELARYHMTVEKLAELSPGNFIELPIHAEQRVKLSVHGKVIGEGELVHLGNQLGIRVTHLA